ncbi:hypothetical protein PG991_013692 [Apiospora marii]|uniref:Uncharacterized protein n=1 Tax=Apiospora marii TaxID=335849 RepID=A0ABR1R7P1_9PEZI
MTTFRPINTRSESDSSQTILLNNGQGTSNGKRHNGWKPWTLKSPALLCLFIITLLLAAVVEFLVQKSQRQGGGLALSESPDNLPSAVNLSYLYLPTIIAVLYSLAWNWVASDTKRLQPWLEMSKARGAPAEDSLLLDYPSTFFGWVPFKAASKRHWPVFLSGMIVLIVTCAITPLQGALLKIESLTVSVDAPFSVASGLPPVGLQSHRMDSTLLNTAYATAFLGHPLHPFTTREYALLPARYQGKPELVDSDTNYTIATTKLSTSLVCWPATVFYDTIADSYEFSNGRGCKIKSVPVDRSSPYTMHYIGWDTSSWSEYGLNQPELCSAENSHQILGVWAKRNSLPTFSNKTKEWSPGEVEMTASFCETRYWKQPVLVSLYANQSVLQGEHDDSIQQLGPAETPNTNEFNTSAFETFMSRGEPPSMEQDPQAEGSAFIYRVNDDRRFKGIGLQRTISNMLGFALGPGVADLGVYRDPERLAKTFEAMHQLMFSLTLGRINSLETSPNTDDVTGAARVSRYGITVSRRFSIAVESLLVIVALLNLCLLWSCHHGQCELVSDPVSIREVANMIKQSDKLRTVLSGIDTESDAEFRYALRKYDFCLRVVGDGKQVQLDMVDSQTISEINNGQRSHLYTPDVPVAMKPLSGCLFVSVLIAAISYLSYLKVIEQRFQGLPLPLENQFTLEILENYVPIVFATLVESLWVLLNRLLATIQPFAELQRGHSLGSRSIDLRYTSLPPQLLLWKAAKAKHILLGLVCLVSILANVLSVSLGGLFNELPVAEDELIEVSSLKAPTITNGSLANWVMSKDATPLSYSEHVTMANIYWSTNTRLPPWLTENYYFLPFELDRVREAAAESYTARSHGVTILPSCKSLPRTTLRRTSIDPPRFSEQPPNSAFSWLNCVDSNDLAENTVNYTGSLAKEIMRFNDEQCGRGFVRGWARATGRNDGGLVGDVEIAGVACQPELATAEFDLTVDSTGAVLQADRVGDFKPFGWGPGNGSLVRSKFESIAFNFMGEEPLIWQNKTIPGDSINYLVMQRNFTFSDPTTPLPDSNTLVTETNAAIQMIMAALFQQAPTLFETAPNSTSTTRGTRRVTITKIFMADVAFIITMALLSLNVVAAIVIYAFGPTSFLPRFPDALGSILGYVARSRLTDPDWEPATTSGEESEGEGEEKPPKTTFSFGRYTDWDGNEHLGIDADPFVIKVDRVGNPEWQGQDNATSWLIRFRGKSSRRREDEECIET